MKNTKITNEGLMTVNASSSFLGQIIPISFKVSKNELEKALGKGIDVHVDVEIDDVNLIIPALTGTSLTVRLQARYRNKGMLPSVMKLSEIISLDRPKVVKEALSKEALDYIKMYRIMWKKASGNVTKCRQLTSLTLDINDDSQMWEIVKENCPQT